MTDLFLQAFFLSSILLAIHGYFGMEIVRRGIIFTDIALGQFSALGLAVSLRFFHGQHTYALAFLGALFGGMLIYLGSRWERYAEAWIGILYALGMASVMLLLAGSPGGAEEFVHLTATDILFTPWKAIVQTGVYYTVIAVLLYARHRWLRGEFRELAFFLLFAATITSSVKLAGVLVVFAILLGPALAGKLLDRGLGFVWAWGTLLNVLAILLSFARDLPTGFTIVGFQTGGVAALYLLRSLTSSR